MSEISKYLNMIQFKAFPSTAQALSRLLRLWQKRETYFISSLFLCQFSDSIVSILGPSRIWYRRKEELEDLAVLCDSCYYICCCILLWNRSLKSRLCVLFCFVCFDLFYFGIHHSIEISPYVFFLYDHIPSFIPLNNSPLSSSFLTLYPM